MKHVSESSVIHRGVFISIAVLVVAALAGAPAFAAKSELKKSKPQETRVEQTSSGGDSTTRFAAFYGTKTLDKNDWSPAEKQTGFGFEVEYVKEDWPASVVGYYFKGDGSGEILDLDVNGDGFSDGDFKATTESTEFGLGARKWLEEGDTVTFFVEAGVAKISLKATLASLGSLGSASDTNSGTGFWFGGGLIYPVTETLNLGATVRMSQVDTKVEGESFGIGGTMLLLTLQYHGD